MTLAEDIITARSELLQTLTHFRQARPLLAAEDTALARAIQAHGIEAVKMALIGARLEPRTDKFDPADWFSLDRVLLAKNFKRFVGLGARQLNQLSKLKRPSNIDWGPLGPPDAEKENT